MPGDLVLITGATGHVGFRVLLEALKKGYRLRAAVRSDAKATQIKTHAMVKPYAKQLETIIVPDMTIDGAFDQALKDVVYIEHIASPVPTVTENYDADIIEPSINATTSILHSALKFPSIRRIVITSSVEALFPRDVLVQGDTKTTYTAHSRVVPLPTGPFQDPGSAYWAAKARALAATDGFVAEHHPHFSVVNLMPSIVVGPDYLDTQSSQLVTGKRSNANVLPIVLGDVSDAPRRLMLVGISDVARIHVDALDQTKVEGSRDFGINVNIESYDVVRDWGLEAFPEAVSNGIFKAGGSKIGVAIGFDASETEQVFGTLDSLQQDMVELCGQYLELKDKEVTDQH